MWKCISRGFRETFERGLNFRCGDGRVRSETQRKGPCCSKFTSFSGNHRWWKSNDRPTSEGVDKDQEDPGKSQKQWHFETTDSFLGAVSCSSGLVLGWVLTQPYYHWRKWWCDGKSRCLRSCCPILSPIQSSLSGLSIVSRVYSLPVNVSNSTVLYCNEKPDQEAITFGPISAEQALSEAAEEVRLVHENTLSMSENERGVEYMSRRRHRQGVALFRRASARNYAPAAYNLAQCYELGLGTKQSFELAAEWYEKAAALGHPGAMYNLAVFHAHGWGGLPADPSRARQLLHAAAAMGQPDARAALTQSPPPPPPSNEELLMDPYDTDSKTDDETHSNSNDFSSDPEALYKMALNFEKASSCKDDQVQPYLIMNLYRFASDLGHSAATARLKLLKAYDDIGLLSDFLFKRNEVKDLCDLEHVLIDSVKVN